VNVYSHFVDYFLLPTLAGSVIYVLAAKWSVKWRLTGTVLVFLIALAVSWSVTHRPAPKLIIAGTVLNDSNDPVGQATITLANGGERYLSEDNGNFMVDLTGKVKESERVRLQVTKDGYSPFDGTVEPPTDNFIVRLHKL
jgi:hypothetical protein